LDLISSSHTCPTIFCPQLMLVYNTIYFRDFEVSLRL
jgi:hypothetical protein